MIQTNNLALKNNKHYFTKGEKCIFFHVIAIFVGILILIVIYFIHLCFVKHDLYDVLKFRRFSSADGKAEYIPVGAVFLDTSQPKSVCNSLLLRKQWSLVPGNCAAMRNDPDLSMMLPYWRIQYVLMETNNIVTTDIIKSLPHPHFNRQNMYHNVGLLEHGTCFDTGFDFLTSNVAGEYINNSNTIKKNIKIASWNWNKKNALDPSIKITTLKFIPNEVCYKLWSFITNFRPYEFCLSIEKEDNLCFEHGALLLLKNKIVGFFSWGARCGNGDQSPVIAANILSFKDWLKDMMKM